jgi:NNP family nitrate/nitrite transporter-like MFS transporter
MTSPEATVTPWDLEDPVFWEQTGKPVAWRTLWISMLGMMISFCVWFMWSAITLQMKQEGSGFIWSRQQLYLLTAMPVILGSFLRIPYGMAVSRFGSRRSYTAVTALLLVPTVATALAVSSPDTPYNVLLICSVLTGIAGANFSTSMGVVNLWFPKKIKGTALGINGLGNLGVTVAQFTIPVVVAIPFLRAVNGDDLYLGNAAWIWVPFILLLTAALWWGTRDFPTRPQSMAEQFVAFKYKHTWVLSSLYFLTFGCFVAMGSTLPLVIDEVFADAPNGAPSPMKFAPWALAVATIMRPVGGMLADRFGAGKITGIATLTMAAGGFCLSAFLAPDNFTSFFVTVLIICAASGMGNGSVFKTLPHVLPAVAPAAIGIVSCLGAFGGYGPPLLLGWSIENAGTPALGYQAMGMYALMCFVLNAYFYLRKSSPSHC